MGPIGHHPFQCDPMWSALSWCQSFLACCATEGHELECVLLGAVLVLMCLHFWKVHWLTWMPGEMQEQLWELVQCAEVCCVKCLQAVMGVVLLAVLLVAVLVQLELEQEGQLMMMEKLPGKLLGWCSEPLVGPEVLELVVSG